jgi:hypothetical protein
MRTKALGGLLALLSLLGGITQAAPLGTAFTYQGQLRDSVNPADGTYDLRFTIYAAASGGMAVAGPITNSLVGVTNGLFALTLDFGPGVFVGEACWLEIGVRTNGGGAFTTLAPRQELTPTPFAFYAPSAGVAATAATAASAAAVAANGVANTSLQTDAVTTDKIADGTLAVADLSAALASNTFWGLGGNQGTSPGAQFLGTRDNRALELKANARRILRLEPDPVNDAPNLIAGSSSNAVAPGVVGAVIGGGGRGPQPNRIFGAWGVISGGELNVVSNDYGVVSGGYANTASGSMSTVGGGIGNVAQDLPLGGATVTGGRYNRADGSAATVGGGQDNAATNQYASVPGGRNNLAGGSDSLAAGRRAKAQHTGAFVWADSSDADFASTGVNQFLIRAMGGVGVGTNNPQTALHVAGTVTAGGFSGSGAGLTGLNGGALAPASVSETALAANAVTSSKVVDGSITAADVSSNAFWKASGNAGSIAGTHFLGTTDNQPLEFQVNNTRGLRLEPTMSDGNHAGIVNVLGGSAANQIGAGVFGATISGGGAVNYFGLPSAHSASANFVTIGGGLGHRIEPASDDATIGGGSLHWIQAGSGGATIGGGIENTIEAQAEAATISGGIRNRIQPLSRRATIGGGVQNTIQVDSVFATIGGGYGNTVQSYAGATTIGGGSENTVETNSFHATISGGWSNHIHVACDSATIGGGYRNAIQANALCGTISGGCNNTAGGPYATVGGGSYNRSLKDWATISGGRDQWATNLYATVPGGRDNLAGGQYSLAAGRRAQALHEGAFVWADSIDADFVSTANNQFNLRATGGVRLDTGAASGVALNAADRSLLTCGWNPFSSGKHSGVGRWGVFMEAHTLALGMPAVGGKTVQVLKYNEDSSSSTLAIFDQSGNLTIAGTLVELSDRTSKENFAPVNCREVLEKVAALPISRWNFKSDATTPHVGPVAQDFHAAFGLGADDKHIATVDADGVALAAIQGLNQRLNEQEAEIQELKRVIAELKATALPPSVR